MPFNFPKRLPEILPIPTFIPQLLPCVHVLFWWFVPYLNERVCYSRAEPRILFGRCNSRRNLSLSSRRGPFQLANRIPYRLHSFVARSYSPNHNVDHWSAFRAGLGHLWSGKCHQYDERSEKNDINLMTESSNRADPASSTRTDRLGSSAIRASTVNPAV